MISNNNKNLLLAGGLLVVSTGALLYLLNRKKINQPKKSLYERLGGAAAVELAVDKFYNRMLADDRVKRFFANTDMLKQRKKQVAFISFAFGAPTKYSGLAMDTAHRKLIKEQGMNDSHFDAVKENLDLTLQELGISKELRDEVASAVEGTREQVMCRGKWAKEEKKEPVQQKTLYERLGGAAAVEAAVDKFYKRMLADKRVARFFKDTNMMKQHQKQVAFMSYAFGSPKPYSGLSMDRAHRKLIKEQGMDDSHFDAVKENLDLTLAELNISQDLRNEVSTAIEGLREQVMCRGKWAIDN